MHLNSTNLKWAEYDEWSGTLTIGFRNGGVYEYYGVPYSRYLGLLNASSHGRYHDQYIKHQYRYRKVSHRSAMSLCG